LRPGPRDLQSRQAIDDATCSPGCACLGCSSPSRAPSHPQVRSQQASFEGQDDSTAVTCIWPPGLHLHSLPLPVYELLCSCAALRRSLPSDRSAARRPPDAISDTKARHRARVELLGRRATCVHDAPNTMDGLVGGSAESRRAIYSIQDIRELLCR